jgi:hypothetical protein
LFEAYDGTDLVTITQAGSVGIGTTTPAYKLDIASGDGAVQIGPNASYSRDLWLGGWGTGTGEAWVRASNGNLHLDSKSGYHTYLNHYTTGNVFIAGGGKLGIGTTSPDQALTVSGAFAGYGIHIDSSTGAGIEIDRGASTNSHGVLFQTAGVDNWYIGNYNDGDALVIKDGKWDGTEIARFTPTGLGIGTTAPLTKLHIVAGDHAEEVARLTGGAWNDTVQGSVFLGFHHHLMTPKVYPSVRIGALETDLSDYDASLVFQTRNSGNDSVPVTRMTISEAGKVGIGTTSPTAPLSIKVPASDNNKAWDIQEIAGTSVFWLNYDGAGTGSTGNSIGFESYWTANMLTIRGDGKVGIGLTAPAAKLQVNGGIGVGTSSSDIGATDGAKRSIQIATDTGYGGTYNAHSGFRIHTRLNAGGWASPSIHFDGASNWGTYGNVNWLIIGHYTASNPHFRSRLIYDRAYSSGSETRVDGDGNLFRYSSSARYKTDIEDLWDAEADKVLDLRPVWFRSTGGLDQSDWSWEGFIAEEVAEINPRWTNYGPVWDTTIETDDLTGETREGYVQDADGERVPTLDGDGNEVLRPEGVQYGQMVPALVNLIGRQKDQITALTVRLEALEAA